MNREIGSQLEYKQVRLKKQDWEKRFTRLLHKYDGGNYSEMGRKLGISSTAAKNICEEGATPGGETLRRALGAYPIEARWLLTGEEPMERTEVDQDKKTLAEIKRLLREGN